MNRSMDSSTSEELEQAVTTVEEGTSAGTSWPRTSSSVVSVSAPDWYQYLCVGVCVSVIWTK